MKDLAPRERIAARNQQRAYFEGDALNEQMTPEDRKQQQKKTRNQNYLTVNGNDDNGLISGRREGLDIDSPQSSANQSPKGEA